MVSAKNSLRQDVTEIFYKNFFWQFIFYPLVELIEFSFNKIFEIIAKISKSLNAEQAKYCIWRLKIGLSFKQTNEL